MSTNIMLCGVGGQGILFAAKVIAGAAEAAGLQVTTNELHGMAQRGGSVTAQVRFGEELHSPLFAPGEADALFGMEPVEALRWAHSLRPGGYAVVSLARLIPVTVSMGQAMYPVDVEERLRRVFGSLRLVDGAAVASSLGDARLVNTVLLGALSARLALSPSCWESSFRRIVRPQLLEANLRAFAAGRGE
ncbi:MAG: indolepyruvate oxidoreductase subunit beta [Oligosphaeraceae bacterium]